MKVNIFFAILLFLLSLSPIRAQQNTKELRSKIVFVYPEFKKGKVLQPFGRSVTDSINIFLKDASLLFKQKGKIMKADLKNILGVVIDSVTYKKINHQLGRVIAHQNYNYLVCVTDLDKSKFAAETTGGEKLPYFDLNDGAFFVPLNQNQSESEIGIPLKKKYYFWLKGETVPANETSIKPYVKENMKEAFKNLMADRWWSWNDEKSLKQLFIYFK